MRAFIPVLSWLTFAFVLVLALAVTPDASAFDENSVPDRTEIGLAEAKIRELFKVEYAEKETGKRLELAQRLAELAGSPSNDAATAFALLSESRRIASEAGDLDLAFAAVDKLARRFSINPTALKAETLLSLPRPRDRASGRNRFRRAIELFDELFVDGDVERARSIHEVAEKSAKAIGSAWLLSVADRREERLKLFERLEEPFEAAELTLRARPDDDEANLVSGLVRGPVLGNWERASRHFEKTKALGEIALMERTRPAFSEEQIRLGDAWLDYAIRLEGDRELPLGSSRDREALVDAIRQRAYFWYHAASAQLDELGRRALEAKMSKVSERFLSDIEAFDTRVGWGRFGQNGELGYPPDKVMVDGYHSRKGISMHAPRSGFSRARFRVGGSYDRVEGFVAINDSGAEYVRGKVVFRILGDGKVLWVSGKLSRRRLLAPFRVRISGCDVLELRADTGGSSFSAAQAVWLDPILTRRK